MNESAPSQDKPGADLEPKIDGILPEVYEELRALALRYMARERSDHTLQATALTHEAYLRLLGQRNTDYHEKSHLLAIAAQAMRRILVDHARGKRRLKHGGDHVRVSFDNLERVAAASSSAGVDLIALDEALSRLALVEPRKARVVELLYLGGMSTTEVAGLLEITKRTVERDWKYARAWLARDLKRQDSNTRNVDSTSSS